jgi:hypothetical protein
MENNQTTTRGIEERRKRNRYRLGVPVIFSWQDARQAQHVGVGVTREITIIGAFVLTATPPPLKAKIKLKLFFPPVTGVAVPMRLHGGGKVVSREAVKHNDLRRGFAVVGKPFVLRIAAKGETVPNRLSSTGTQRPR